MRRLDVYARKKTRPKSSEDNPAGVLSGKIRYTPYDHHVEKLANAIRQGPGYGSRLSYVRDRILSENPKMTHEGLSRVLGVPEGEAIVILSDIYWAAVEEEQNNASWK